MAGTRSTAAGTGSSSSPEPVAEAVTTAEEEEGEEEAAVSTSTDGDEETINAKRGRVRGTIKIPDAAAVLARVALSCKTEPMEGREGRGTLKARVRVWCYRRYSYF